jgi:Protein of unknown function (DUF465)
VPPSQHRARAAADPGQRKIIGDFLRLTCSTPYPPNQTQVLDRRIEEEEHRPLPDAIRLADLKKQKLRVKEEIVLAH